ncbi:5-hydroxytryptamine receptor 3C-like isoform X2 [Nymphalis io]|uniref:5-hydroxytryptamine receptor 3C-like isoform X2 n=1 Tax=Inachis io TaxID=171585 RepID=UPI002167F97C|nr:5-hydroxytryptamine receptor 3C-like isoform X2 [Nymphalis io]
MASESASLLIALLIFIIGERRVTCVCDNVTSISTQVDLLLAEYDRGAFLVSPIHVKAALDVQHATIDEKASTVRLLAALYLSWEDKRLSWNASSWGCDNALVSAERLWLPDVGVLSAATVGGIGGDVGLRARLTSDGRVSWVVRLDLVSPLTLTLDAWPRDVQEIIYKFGSRSHTTDELNLTSSDMEHAMVFESGTWELISVRSTDMTWQRLDEEQQVLLWKLTLRRRAPAHALATRAVLYACIVLLIAAMLLPPASRPALCATAALTAALWLIAALARLPGASSAPLAMSLMCAVCTCSAAAAAGAALVLRVARCSAPPPHALRALVTATSTFCKLGPPEGSNAEWSAWAAAAQLLDHVLLSTILLTLFVVACFTF